jgi:hypothetical protein
VCARVCVCVCVCICCYRVCSGRGAIGNCRPLGPVFPDMSASHFLPATLFLHTTRARIQSHQWYAQLPSRPLAVRPGESEAVLLPTGVEELDQFLPEALAYVKKIIANCEKVSDS